ncbi:MAG: exodeoxyribonuclease VII large subunit [Vampirovibrionales bacterium]|nr:exodeoxyribonuclease VII large subunit [Vampirovibrionales bacterium]
MPLLALKVLRNTLQLKVNLLFGGAMPKPTSTKSKARLNQGASADAEAASTQLSLTGTSPALPWTVSRVTQHLCAVLEEDAVLGQVLSVRGELSNVKKSSRGHVYFTLKDESASLNAVLWASRAASLPFKLADGQDVIATGLIEVYAPSGSYSLVTQSLEPAGIGALQLAFEQLKAKLSDEGMFDPERKKPLAEFPFKIGIVTASTGAVIHDMLRVINQKNPKITVTLAPVAVQGAGAAQQIAQAIAALNHPKLGLEAIIVARGGGSFEDLFCFSEEPVVRAIAESRVPIITGIGHEPDYGLADAAADYSASTPTAAAEHAVGDLTIWQDFLTDVGQQLPLSLHRGLDAAEQTLDILTERMLSGVKAVLLQAEAKLGLHAERLPMLMQQQLQGAAQQLAQYAASLEALSPLAILSRGYAAVLDDAQQTVKSVRQVHAGQKLMLRLQDGAARVHVDSVEKTDRTIN